MVEQSAQLSEVFPVPPGQEVASRSVTVEQTYHPNGHYWYESRAAARAAGVRAVAGAIAFVAVMSCAVAAVATMFSLLIYALVGLS